MRSLSSACQNWYTHPRLSPPTKTSRGRPSSSVSSACRQSGGSESAKPGSAARKIRGSSRPPQSPASASQSIPRLGACSRQSTRDRGAPHTGFEEQIVLREKAREQEAVPVLVGAPGGEPWVGAETRHDLACAGFGCPASGLHRALQPLAQGAREPARRGLRCRRRDPHSAPRPPLPWSTSMAPHTMVRS